MSKKIVVLVGMLMALSLVLAACAPAPAPAPTEAPKVEAPAPVDPMVKLVEDAKKEGVLVSYGLPDSWVNYGQLRAIFEQKYGIKTQDTDMGSGEIIAALEAEANAPVADITDLGLNFAKLVEDEKLSQPYKHSYWDELPDYAKDPQGRWSAAYWGAIAFLVNGDAVKTIPASWDDLLNDEYVGKVCLREVRTSATAQMVVLGAAYAHGGDINNPQPGLDYFKQLVDKKILTVVKPSISNVQKGECPISLFWDFDALGFSSQLPDMKNLHVVIPSDGTVAGLYVQFVTAGAPHPNAAKLLLELAFSDEGQLNYAKRFVHPIRTSVKLPAELLAHFPPEEKYASVNFPKDYIALDKVCGDIAIGWENVAPKK